MNIDTQQILTWLNGLYGMPKVALTFILCLAAGWILKKSPWIPNARIPSLICLGAAIILPLLSDFTLSSIKSVRVFIVTNVVIGFITGAASTFFYRFIIKKLLDKFGADDGPSDPPWPNADGSNVAPDPRDRILNPPVLPNKP